jgi:hypothetical protein
MSRCAVTHDYRRQKGSPHVNTRRIMVSLGAAATGLASASLISLATARADADEFIIEPSGLNTIVSTSGIAPFDQTIVESGPFSLDDLNGAGGGIGYLVTGQLTNYSDIFGLHNEDFVVATGSEFSPFTAGSVIDELSLGSGFENVYIDSVGTGLEGQNVITDTFYTPFGDFNLPITIDAAIPSEPAAALAAVDPVDFTHLLAEFGSLF